MTTSDGHTGTITDTTWSPTMIELADIANGPFSPETTVSGALSFRALEQRCIFRGYLAGGHHAAGQGGTSRFEALTYATPRLSPGRYLTPEKETKWQQ